MARKKRVTKKQREERLRRLIWPWLWWLGIHQRYRVSWCWVSKMESGPWMKGQVAENKAAATGFGNYPYREIHLCLVRWPFDTHDDDDIEHMLLHELLHADVLWPMRRIMNGLTADSKGKVIPKRQADRTEYATLEESAVDLLTHWLMRLKPEGGLPLLLKEHVRDKKV